MARKERYVVIDPETNSIVLEQGAHEHAHPASLTKMLNLAMVFEALSHNSTKLMGGKVKIPEKGIPERLAQFESFKFGESYDIDILLAASGNKSEARSTIALAHVLGNKDVYSWGGNESQRRERFLEHTNKRLEEIGLTDTDIHVLTGWYNSKHHTTARDIAVAMDYIQSNFPKSAENAMGQRVASILTPYTSKNPIHSSRVLQARPEQALWAKTGYLKKHGYSQAVYYEKDGKPLIAVVLGSQSKGANNAKVFEVLTKAYEKLKDSNYKPEAEYQDVEFNRDAPLPTKNVTGQTIPISADTLVENRTTPKTEEPSTVTEAKVEETSTTTEEKPEETSITAEDNTIPRTPEGYPDFSKIPIETIPIPVFRSDKTIRFPLCDAPPSLAPIELGENVLNRLTRAFTKADPNAPPPQTDQEMFDAVYSTMFRDKMISEEGYFTNVYKDSEGFPTVGIGHLIGDDRDLLLQGRELKTGDEISDLCVNRLFERDASKAINAAIEQARDLNVFEKDVVIGLVSMNFQLGEAWPREWPGVYNHIKAGDFENAMIELVAGKTHRITNDWIKQTPSRVINALKMIANEITEDRQEAATTITQQAAKIAELQDTIAELTGTSPATIPQEPKQTLDTGMKH